MGYSVYPALSSGGIKTVQRGSAGGSGNVTITAVDINKSFVNIFGTTSSGTVAVDGGITASNGNIAATNMSGNGSALRVIGGSGLVIGSAVANTIAATTFTGNTTSISGGTSNLVAAIVQGFLADSTTLTVSGACRWEVVEFA
jgi:hypothetical protein